MNPQTKSSYLDRVIRNMSPMDRADLNRLILMVFEHTSLHQRKKIDKVELIVNAKSGNLDAISRKLMKI